MKKTIRTLGIVVIGFVFLISVMYRLRLHHLIPLVRQSAVAHDAPTGLRTAEGLVEVVNPKAMTLILAEDGRTELVHFDNQTVITEFGRNVQPSAITPGARVIIDYQLVHDEPHAKSISLNPEAPRAVDETERTKNR